MTPDLATFRILFPEFASVADEVVQFYLDEALEELDSGAWGRCYAKAVLNYAAHELALAQARTASASNQNGSVVVPQTGKLQSGSEEGISFSFEASTVNKSASGEWLAQTPYGQAFLALQRQCLDRGMLSW